MRKFRSFNGKYMDEVIGFNYNCSGIDKNVILVWDRETGMEKYYANDIDLMQYIGLKDINGKEIYEGDIVECKNEMICWVGKVVFKDCRFCIEINDRYSTHWQNFKKIEEIKDMNATIQLHNVFKIIGNIYENKDLLGE